MSSLLRDVIRRHNEGEAVGIYSVCSAHPLVIEAAVIQALEDGSPLLVEATSNQVDQFGGYTGMKPEDFRHLVLKIAHEHGLKPDRIILGGDHLGPNTWQDRPAEEAMQKAEALIESYVRAGFTKIHLDCSMPCVDDPTPLNDSVTAERAARLAAVSEKAATEVALTEKPLYIVGTEVPVPGGASETLTEVEPTDEAAARATIEAHQRAFRNAGVGEAWERVVGLVVQPGVEFDHTRVIAYERGLARDLSQVAEDRDGLVFEAHSTDYQTQQNLKELVEDHWAILKVGPALTFALRESLFALEALEAELIPEERRSNLRRVVEKVMLSEPGRWQKYYHGNQDEQRLLRSYSYSDRIRYYWNVPEIQAAQERLFSNLSETKLPLPLVSQYLPLQYQKVRDGMLSAEPKALVLDHIRSVLKDYVFACDPRAEEARV